MHGLCRSFAPVAANLGSSPAFVPVRTHLGYIPRQGPANPRANDWEQTKIQLTKVNMKPVKKVHYRFDPFHPKPHSIMRVMTHLSAERIQKSNVKCFWKTDVVCDRSEPTLKIELNDGDSLLFKTANLQDLEILTMINDYILPRVVEETAAPVETKSASSGGGKKGGKGKKK